MLRVRQCIGFTVAEVLIVLGVIGIIANMVMPTLISGVDNRRFRSGAMTALKLVSTAVNQMAYENGGVLWDRSDSNGYNRSLEMLNSFGEHLKYLKTGYENIYKEPIYYYNSSASSSMNIPGYWHSAFLSNGMFIRYMDWGGASPTCDHTATSLTGFAGSLSNLCGGVQIDTNGVKPPNMIGKDVIFFWIQNPSGDSYVVIPAGSKDDGLDCSVEKTTSCINDTFAICGVGCTTDLIYTQQ